MPKTKGLLTIIEAAKYLDVCPMTIHRKRKAGMIKAYKIGRFCFYSKKDLKELRK